MSRFAAAALLTMALAVIARADTEQHVIVLRGRYKAGGPAIFNYAGEMRSAAYGRGLADSIGLDETQRVRLERVVQRYQARPRTATNADQRPLYVLLDEDGQSVSAWPGTPFTLIRPGGASELVSDGFVDVGAGAPERPFVQPWWSWYRAAVKPRPRAIAAAAPAAVAPAAPAAVAAVSAPRTAVYPADYRYVAPPRPARVATAQVRRIHYPANAVAAYTGPQSARFSATNTPAWRSFTPASFTPAVTSAPRHAFTQLAQASFAHAPGAAPSFGHASFSHASFGHASFRAGGRRR